MPKVKVGARVVVVRRTREDVLEMHAAVVVHTPAAPGDCNYVAQVEITSEYPTQEDDLATWAPRRPFVEKPSMRSEKYWVVERVVA